MGILFVLVIGAAWLVLVAGGGFGRIVDIVGEIVNGLRDWLKKQ